MINLSFVAFIDVLGFADMVRADFESPGENSNLSKLETALTEVIARAPVDVHATQFSDSIVLALPFAPSSEKLSEFVALCSDLQWELFIRGVLIRGGIAHGRHYHNGAFVFSQALIDAYRLESISARYPRVIVSQETLSLIGSPIDGTAIDADDQVFVHFGRSRDLMAVTDGHAACTIGKSTNASVREKRDWLSRYLKFCVPECDIPMGAMRDVT